MHWMLDTPAMAWTPPTLGQDASSAGAVVGWVIVLIVAALIGGLVILAVRKKLLEPDRPVAADEGLFDALRRMRDSGEISPSEYEVARRRLIESATRKKEEPKPSPDQAAILQAAGLDRGAEATHARRLDAPPGYDLTGEPLPKVRDRSGPAPDSGGADKRS